MSLLVDIKKDFGDFKLSCQFESKEGILGFLGASGSGKSMTLRCIAGILTPDEGKIILNGVTLFDKEKKINLPPQKRKVGYLFQNYGLFPNMTLEKNILCGLHKEKNQELKRKQAQDIIHKMQLTGLEKRKPHQLSGGQQQRTALARIIVNGPELLLLDEPFSALDSYLRDQLVTEMKHILQEFGKDIILVSHSRDEIYQLCDEVAIIEQGKIHEKGKVKAVFADPKTVQGAILSGCKNVVKARKKGEYEVEIPDWKVTFRTAKPVGDNIEAIGIRAHYFNTETKENTAEIEWVETIERPFEWTLKFRYKGSNPEAPAVWWRITKEKKPAEFPKRIGITPQDIMLLYKEEL